MPKLRVIAIENVISGGCLCCVYDNDKLYVYDTSCELYYQKEYFSDLESLEYMVNNGKYFYSDFYIEKGDIVTSNFLKDIYVNDELLKSINKLNEEDGSISELSTRLYYEFLSKTIKNNEELLQELKEAYTNGIFKKQVDELIVQYPIEGLSKYDAKLTVLTRLKGLGFLMSEVKRIIISNDRYKLDEIHFIFSRLFMLEKSNYISLDM